MILKRSPGAALALLVILLTLTLTLTITLALAGAPRAQEFGPVTGLPLPRFVSLKAHKTNVRRGPGLINRIDWVYRRQGWPVEIIAEYGHWREIRDIDGEGGWVHYSLLSGVHTVLVRKDMTPLRAEPRNDARIKAYAERDVIARLHRCVPGWCRISTGGTSGWAPLKALWGARIGKRRN